MSCPVFRLRRLRKNNGIRQMIRETHLSRNDLIMPFFVVPGRKIRQAVKSMPGVMRFSIDNLIKEVKEVDCLGIPAILLFGIPQRKDKKVAEAYKEKGVVQQAIRCIKKEFPEMVVITDVCLCSYTSHGHCGVVIDEHPASNDLGQKKNKKSAQLSVLSHQPEIDNDETIELLAKIALSHARAGADIVAPSAMMDGQVKAIREILDKNDFSDVSIMSYSAKYASSFYGPFREAVDSAPQFGSRESYQMDPANSEEALREVKLDIEEGADIVMVKPALSYLDVIFQIKQKFNYPVAAYNVSGEYSMVKAAAQKGWIDEKKVILEILTSIKRAGSDMILTYYAREAAKWLQQMR